MKRRDILLILGAATILAAAGYLVFSGWRFDIRRGPERIACTTEAKLCSDGTPVGRTGPACEFAACPKEDLIRITSPRAEETILSPLSISGEARGTWFFEASFAIRLVDEHGSTITTAIATAKTDWMTQDFVPFEATMRFSAPSAERGYLIFEKDNPSGLPEHADRLRMPIRFAGAAARSQKIKLYYYDPARDTDEAGMIRCSRNGIIPITREIPITQTPVRDTITLLLKGKANLNEQDIGRGIGTEFPLEGLSLASANLKPDGALILEFRDPNNRTSGGACRAGILWFQIEATAKQFPGVKEVRFTPSELFQP